MKSELTPDEVVTGRVLEEDGEPMAHVSVQALQYIYSQGIRQLNQGGFASTNDLGEFRMIDLLPGRYLFRASPLPVGRDLPAHTVKTFEERGYSETFYPDGDDISQSTAQEDRAGRNIRSGQLGSRRIYAKGNERREWRLKIARQQVTVGAHDVVGLTLSLETGFKVSGSIIVEGSAVIDKKSWIQVVFGRHTLRGMNNTSGVMVREDNTFELGNVLPDIYTVNVLGAMQDRYVKSIRFAGKESTDGTIDFTQHHAGVVQLILGGDPGRIHDITNPGVIVTASSFGASLQRDRFVPTITGVDGRFQFENLAPGEYNVMAWETQDWNIVQSPELRKLLENKATSVSLAPNGTEVVQLKLISNAHLEEAISKFP